MTTLPALSVTDRYRLKELTLQESAVLPAGKVMWCQGRKILGYGSIDNLARVSAIPSRADTACISAADFRRIKDWIR